MKSAHLRNFERAVPPKRCTFALLIRLGTFKVGNLLGSNSARFEKTCKNFTPWHTNTAF
jgi:hypothetical protein